VTSGFACGFQGCSCDSCQEKRWHPGATSGVSRSTARVVGEGPRVTGGIPPSEFDHDVRELRALLNRHFFSPFSRNDLS
jgi:hypothetical protein